MHELIALILSLPEFTLTPDEWAELSSIISALDSEKKTVDEITVRISKIEGDSALKSNPKLISYISKWLEISKGIESWLQYLNRVWGEITDKPLAADELIPLCMEMVPNQIAQLQQLLAKLDQVGRICDITELGYALTTLYSAMFGKLSELKTPPKNQMPDKNAALIKSVVTIINRHEHLKLVTAEYRKEMLNVFVEQLKLLDNTTYLALLTTLGCKETELDKIKLLDAFIDGSEKKVPKFNSDVLAAYFQKYMVITDMYYTLIRDDETITHIHIEFAAKFTCHKEFLYKNDTRPLQAVKSSFTRLYSLFAAKNIEEQFIELGNECIKNLPKVPEEPFLVPSLAVMGASGSASTTLPAAVVKSLPLEESPRLKPARRPSSPIFAEMPGEFDAPSPKVLKKEDGFQEELSPPSAHESKDVRAPALLDILAAQVEVIERNVANDSSLPGPALEPPHDHNDPHADNQQATSSPKF